MEKKQDIETGQPPRPTPIPHLTQVFDQGVVTPDIINYPWKGSGTEDDPYQVTWIEDDPRNPQGYSLMKKWPLVILMAIATMTVAFDSSAYSGGTKQIIEDFHSSEEVTILGVALFVLGFALGPLAWAPLSELFGRQYLFVITFAALSAFSAGAAGSQNIQTLVILRFFGGCFGASPFTNAGGVIADMFPARQRGLAMSFFGTSVFLGPSVGPIVGGFVGETVGWRWIEGVMAIFTGVLWLAGWLLMPETYAPVLLQKRAARLTKITGKFHLSKTDAEHGKLTMSHAFKTNMLRPWLLLFREPIVFILSVYLAIVYGTLYMLFAAFPIVFQEVRGWDQGIGGLAFIGVLIGNIFSLMYSIWDNKRYARVCDSKPGGFAPPEARVPPIAIGGIAVPVGLFWFAWTNYPTVHWASAIAAGIPFGFGMVLIFLGILNYLIDSYVIFAASVLAANSVIRSLFGAVFPLFTDYMFNNLGIHWASSVPAFLALGCAPFPFVLMKYGPAIRTRCKYAAEADAFLKKMRGQMPEKKPEPSDEGDESDVESEPDTAEKDDHKDEDAKDKDEIPPAIPRNNQRAMQQEQEREQEAFDFSYEDETEGAHGRQRAGESAMEPIRMPTQNRPPVRRSTNASYEASPFDIDRVNTRNSFVGSSTSSFGNPSRRSSFGSNKRNSWLGRSNSGRRSGVYTGNSGNQSGEHSGNNSGNRSNNYSGYNSGNQSGDNSGGRNSWSSTAGDRGLQDRQSWNSVTGSRGFGASFTSLAGASRNKNNNRSSWYNPR